MIRSTEYIFNERKKRLEPPETKCTYCKSGSSKSMEENYFVPVYNVMDRTNIIVYSSVKYKKISIGIPRCSNCYKIHDSAIGIASLYCWGGGLLILLIFVISCGVFDGLIFGIFPCLLIGTMVPMFIKNIFITNKGIPTEIEGAKKNELVKDFIIQGWSLSQPLA